MYVQVGIGSGQSKALAGEKATIVKAIVEIRNNAIAAAVLLLEKCISLSPIFYCRKWRVLAKCI
jgi:hypothetical protein